MFFLSTLLFTNDVKGQKTKLDSIINSRTTTIIEGVVPAYIIQGYDSIATLRQSLITEAIIYYQSKYKALDFHVKLSILDSTNWITEIFPYGYTFAHSGWIVMPGDIDFNDFIRIYGASTFKNELMKESLEKMIKPDDIPESIFHFAAIHELGHLIVGQKIKEVSLGIFLNELAANIIAYEFLKNNRPDLLNGWILFYNVDIQNYNPFYKTMSELYDNYGKMSVDNYLWYHCNFMTLVEEINKRTDLDFLFCLEKLTQNNKFKDMDINEIVFLLDKDYDGIFTKWLEKFKK